MQLNVRGQFGSLESEHLSLPGNKSERRIFANYLATVSTNNPLTFYVGSCPDYAHNGQYYTHQGIGGNVPLLTLKHLASSKPLFEKLENARIPYEYVVMVADVEAMDQVFCDKFTQGNKDKFLDLCRSSVESTTAFIQQNFPGMQYGKLRSSSFFAEFGQDCFMGTVQRYKELLHSNYEKHGSMHTRIYNDTYSRINMYQTMYDRVLPLMTNREKEDFLIGRTERTMAQYLALGRLISSQGKLSSIICHPTLNMGMFNDRNKLLLPEDSTRTPQPTLPIFAMNRRVYS